MKPIPYFGNYSLFTIHYNLRWQGSEERNEQMTESIIFTKAKAFTSLCGDCTELIKMLTSRVKTVKAK